MDIWDLGVGTVKSSFNRKRANHCSGLLHEHCAFLDHLPQFFPRRRMKPELFKKPPEGTIPMTPECGFVNMEFFDDWLEHVKNYLKER